jgi:hypothetical protein
MVPTTTKHVAIDKRRAAQLGITLIPGMLQPGVGPEKWWTRKRIRFDGVRTTLCSICGEARRLQPNIVTTNRRKALWLWSSGGRGGKERRYQPRKMKVDYEINPVFEVHVNPSDRTSL